jgi:hypothetical protein
VTPGASSTTSVPVITPSIATAVPAATGARVHDVVEAIIGLAARGRALTIRPELGEPVVERDCPRVAVPLVGVDGD